MTKLSVISAVSEAQTRTVLTTAARITPMTDITELAQRMKAAAEKATPGEWCAYANTKTGTFAIHTPDDSRFSNIIDWMGFDGVDMPKTQKSRNAKFIALANPANVTLLVEALGKALDDGKIYQQSFFRQCLMYDVVAEAYEEAKQRIAEDVEIKTRLCRESNSLFDRLRAAEERIAELEREQEHLRPVGVMSEKAYHRLENRESRFIALWPRPEIYLPRKRPEDGVIVYARTAATAGIKREDE